MVARLKTKILEEIDFEVDETNFWKDSEIVLHYLSNTRRDSACTYYTELLELPPHRTLHHISGTINVADNCTRAKEIHELTPESRCISSTQFFMLPEEEWSSSKEDLRVNDSELEVAVSVLTTSIAPSVIVVEWEKYSTWKSLIRLYALPGWQIKISTADDLKEGSLASCKIAQIKSFWEGYKDLQATQALSKSPLLPLRPVLTEGGRLDKALRQSTKYLFHQNILCTGCWFKTFTRNTST